MNKKDYKFGLSLLIAAWIMPCVMEAQDKLRVSVGADVVSKYVWRGVDQGQGAAIQPSMDFSYKGFSLSAWGSTPISDLDVKEFDVTLGYEIRGFGVSLTDYYWNADGTNKYGMWKQSHLLEAAVRYDFGETFPLTLSWATMVAGADKKIAGGGEEKQNYSSYISASYDFNIGGVGMNASVGAIPFKSYIYGFEKGYYGLTDVSLKATKEIKGIPLFVQVTAAPKADKAYILFGITF